MKQMWQKTVKDKGKGKILLSSQFEADTETVVHLQAGDAGWSFTSVSTQVPVLMVSLATT